MDGNLRKISEKVKQNQSDSTESFPNIDSTPFIKIINQQNERIIDLNVSNNFLIIPAVEVP